jgi:hypothetical protein
MGPISISMLKEKKYCAAPWRSLHLNFEGQIKTCCAGNPNMLGTNTDGSIEQILQGPVLKEIKQSIKQGILHEVYCKGCIGREEVGFGSERDWHNNISPDFNFTTAEDSDHKPALIDVRWNNTCNLACTYCSEVFSTKWASIKGIANNENIKDEYTQVIDYIDTHKHHVKEVAMVGGEPLMMKENNALLDILPEDVLVTVITNMTTDFDKFPVPKKLLARKRVGWSMSFDNIGKRFEYVRWGSTWETLDKNVTTVAKRINSSEQHGGIHSVYNIYNCTKLCDLKQYAVDKGVSIMWQHVWGDQLDPTQHNQKIRTLAIEEIKKFRNTFEPDENDTPFLNATEQQLLNGNGNRSLELKQFTEKVEKNWHLDQKGQFVKLWPELAEAL